MKLNFWQWIGIIVVVIAAILIIRREFTGTTKPSPAPVSPATTPAP